MKGEAEKLERVQKRAARWARGARGIFSITALLNDLGWPSLADRRRNQRLCLFYKLLNGHFNISPEEFDLKSPARETKTSHNKKLQRLSGRDQHSPLWRSTIVRTMSGIHYPHLQLRPTLLTPSSVGWPQNHSARTPPQDETLNDSGLEPTEDHREWVHFSPYGWSFTVATHWLRPTEYFLAFAGWSHAEWDRSSLLGVKLIGGHSKWDRLRPVESQFSHCKIWPLKMSPF